MGLKNGDYTLYLYKLISHLSSRNLILLILLISSTSNAQSKVNEIGASDSLLFKDYPEGVYFTKEDFINKRPGRYNEVYAVGMFGKERLPEESKVNQCFFLIGNSGQKVSKVFAISYNGELYFQVKSILKNRNKNDRAQSSSYPKSFARVIMGGENYLYLETELVNKWAAGTAVNFGVAGGAIYQDLKNVKGIIWDFQKHEFNIFKSCNDFNEFIKDRLESAVQSCPEQQANLEQIRNAISQIK